MKSAHFRNKRAVFLLAASVLLSLALGAGFLYAKKDDIRSRFTTAFEERVREALGLRFQVDRIGGTIFGSLTLRGLSVYSKGPDGQDAVIFKADEAKVFYKPFDFLTGNASAWVRIELNKPLFYADVPFSPSPEARSRLPQNFQIFSKIVDQMRQKTRLIITDGAISWLGREGDLSGIEGLIEDKQFDLQVSLNHIRVGGADLSTQISIKGHIDPLTAEPRISGYFKTLGTVVNWKPVTRESKALFELTQKRFTIKNASVLSGIELTGGIGYADPIEMDLAIKMRDYPLSNLNEFFPYATDQQLTGVADADITLSGTPLQPMIKGQLTLKQTLLDGKQIKNMQLNFQGIYPELNVSESRIVMEDGTTMSFANQRVLAGELFITKTYQQLISRQDQDDVTWGNWRLIRQDNEESVVVERDLGEAAKLKYERFEKNEAHITPDEPKDQVEFEYKLTGSNSLTMEVSEDDEKFVGVKNKMAF